MAGADIFDIIVVLTLLACACAGFYTGLIGELSGIVSLIAGFWGASAWNGLLAPYLQFISSPLWQTITAWIIVFIAIMAAIGILARILRKVVALSFVSWLDKGLGGILGLAKGVFLWTIIVIILLKLLPDAGFLRNSQAMPWFLAIIEQLKPWLPAGLMPQGVI